MRSREYRRVQMVREFPGSETMRRNGWVRLASHVWQKAFPSGILYRAVVDGLGMDVTVDVPVKSE